MPARRLGAVLGAAILIALASLAASTPARQTASSARPLETALYPSGIAEVDRAVAAGATKVRLTLLWPSVAPALEPSDWNPTDPADPNYDWTEFDGIVRRAQSRGLNVYVTVMGAPKWAQQPPVSSDPSSANLPDPAAFGAFGRALAKRFSGSFQGLPRIRFFQAWNEPNLTPYLSPQLVRGRPVSPAHYRRMLNAFAAAVHAVRRDNVVIVGGLAPFRDLTPSVMAQNEDWGPLSFMRALLCISRSLRPTCKTKVDFDVWATHPYTSGNPTHKAVLANDVSLGDLPEMRAVLDAAVRHRQLTTPSPGFWVTEFSWDTSPPDPKAVPTMLHRRWVAEALYRMWQNRVSLVTWLQVRDHPLSDPYQSGLWYEDGRPKPSLRAFRFPFVALRSGSRISVWGRTPHSRPRRVVIQQSVAASWRRVAVLSADRFGVFRATVTGTTRRGPMRAVLADTNEASVPFSLVVPPDRIFNPFGGPPLEPHRP